MMYEKLRDVKIVLKNETEVYFKEIEIGFDMEDDSFCYEYGSICGTHSTGAHPLIEKIESFKLEDEEDYPVNDDFWSLSGVEDQLYKELEYVLN